MRREQTRARKRKRKRRGSAALQPRCEARKRLTVAAERQGEHDGVELQLSEIQVVALGLKVAWGLALGLGREAVDTGLLFKEASACGSCQNAAELG